MVDFTDFNSFSDALDAANASKPQTNTSGSLIGSALKSGGLGALGSLSGAAAAGARVVGADDTANTLSGYAKSLNAQSEAAGRSDIEQNGYFGNGVGGFLKKGAYDVVKSLPTLAGVVGAGALAGAALPEEALAGAGGVALKLAPRLFGADAAAAKVGAGLIGGAGVLAPEATGSLYEAAEKQPGGASRADALKAIAMGVPLGAVQALVPASGAGSLFGTKTATGLLGAAGREAAANAAAGVVGGGLQAAAEGSFDPNQSFADRAQNIVSAAVQGGAIGGLLGGGFGLLHGSFGHNMETDQLDQTVSHALGLDPTNPSAPAQPTAPIAPQTLPGAPPDVVPPPGGPARPPVVQSDPAAALSARYGGEPAAAPTQEALLERFMQGYDQTPGLPAVPDGVPQLGGPSPTALRLSYQPREQVPVDTGPAQLTYQPREAPELPGRTPDASIPLPDQTGVITLPDKVGDTARGQALATIPEQGRDPRAPVKDQVTAALEHFEALRREATGNVEATPDGTPTPNDAQPTFADPRLDASTSLGPDPRKVAEREAMMNALRRPMTLDEVNALFADDLGAPRGDVSDVELRRQQATDDSIARDRRRIQSMFEGVDRRGTGGDVPASSPREAAAPPTAVPDTPLSISDRVTNAAHELTGGTGGEAKIGDIRKALPDLAAGDIDNALRQIHGDDSDSTLTQAPKGARTGVDGVSVQGQGRFHNLSVEARDNGEGNAGRVQERGAAPEAVGDQSQGGGADGRADAAGGEAPRAGGEGTDLRQQGTPGEPAASREATPAAPAPVAGRVKLKRPNDGGSTYQLNDPSGNTISEIRRTPHGDPGAWETVKPGTDEVTGTYMTQEAALKATQAEHDGRVAAAAPAPLVERARAAIESTTRDNGSLGKMRDVRAALADVPRDQQDAVLKQLQADGEISLQRDDRGSRSIPKIDHEAAIDVAGDPRHYVMKSTPAPEPAAPAPVREARVSNQTAEGRIANQMKILAKYREAARAGAGDAPKAAPAARAPAAPRAPRPTGDPATDRMNALASRTGLSRSERQELQDLMMRNVRPLGIDDLSSPQAPEGPPQMPALARPDQVKPKLALDPAPRATGYTADNVRSDFRDAIKGLKPEVAARVHLVDDANGLPADLRAQAEEQGLDLRDVPAMYHRGEVYLRADQMSSRAYIEDAISHEVFGHMATAERVGDMLGANANRANFDASLADAFDRAGGLDGLQKIAEKYGVWDGTGNDGVGLKGYVPEGDPSELTPHQKSVLLDELIAHAAAATEVGPKQRALMEYVGAIKQVIADYLRKAGLTGMADRMGRFDENDVAKWIADSRAAMSDQPPPNAIDLASLGDDRLRFIGGGATHDPVMAKLIRSQNEEAGGVVRLGGGLSNLVDRIPAGGVRDFADNALTGGVRKGSNAARTLSKALDKISSGYGMVRKWGSSIDGMTDHYELGHLRGVAETRITEAHDAGNRAMADLRRADPKVAGITQEVQQRATSANIDPSKSWAENVKHLGVGEEPGSQKLQDLQAEHAELKKLWDGAMAQNNGAGQKVYRMNEAAQRGDNYSKMAVGLQTLHDTSFAEKLPGFENNAIVDYVRRNDLHADPMKYEQYMKAQYEQRRQAMDDYLNDNKASPGETTAMNGAKVLGDIKSLLDIHDASLKAMDEGPYFHLGRHGDFFVSAHLRTDADGNLDPKDVAELSKGLARNFSDVQLNTLTNNAHLFMRVQSPAEMEALRAIIASKTHLLDKTSDGIRSGNLRSKATDGGFNTADIPMLQRIMADAQAKLPDTDDPTKKAVQDAFLNDLRASLVDLLPDNSIRTVYQQRQGVQGYSRNQLANNVYRGQVTARSLATAATRPGQLDASARMYEAARQGQLDPNGLKNSDHVDAYLQRAAAAAVPVDKGLVNMARSFVHNWYIAGSPAYVVMQLSQLGTLVLPELGSRYGYAKSMAALARTAPDVYKVLSAIAKNGNFDTGGITEKVLADSGLSEAKKQLIRDLTNSGHIELGSYTRSMADVDNVSSGPMSTALRYAKGTGTMAEVAGRLSAALAAHDLHTSEPGKSGFTDSHQYAGHVLSEGMFNWGSYDTPALFTAGGPLGQAGPLVFQFHQFATKLFEKVAYETSNGFTARNHETKALNETPEQTTARDARNAASSAASRKFMYGHLAAVTFLAGSLGLPAAGWSAAAATQLSGLFNGGEGYDVQAHYRDFLTDVVGKDVGEILARGVPRYLGLDMSDLGDNSIMPMQRLLEDHRNFKDASTSYLGQAWGNTPNLLVNAITAMQKIRDGRIGEAAVGFMPTAVRNAAKAYRLSEYGYLNGKGEQMPLKPSALDVVKTAMGFTPGEQAEEEDRSTAIQNAKEDRTQHAGRIKQQLAIAMERGDRSGAADMMAQVKAYDADPSHKGQPIGPSLPQYLEARMQAVAYGKATGLPVGTAIKDLNAKRLVNF